MEFFRFTDSGITKTNVDMKSAEHPTGQQSLDWKTSTATRCTG